MRYVVLSLLLISFYASTLAQNEKLNTTGDQSPAVIAEQVRITYGVAPGITIGLLRIYEQEGIPANQRTAQVKALIEKYKQLPLNGKEVLTDVDKEKLGIQNKEALASALNFDLFLSTKGTQSPAIYAPNGDVQIWYGIAPEAFKGIWNALEKRQVAIEDFDKKLKESIEKYKELEAQLKLYTNYDEVTQKAKALLNKGDIEGAERILDNASSNPQEKQVAFRNYVKGQIKEILLKYQEATEFLELAYKNEKNNIYYCIAYAKNLSENANYKESLKYYKTSLSLIKEQKDSVEYLYAIYNNIAIIYDNMDNPNESIEYYKKILTHYGSLYGDSSYLVTRILNNIGSAYGSKGDYVKAIEYLQKAISIDSIKRGEYSELLINKYLNLYKNYDELKFDSVALYCLDRAQEIAEKIYSKDARPIFAHVYYQKGTYYLKHNKNEEAMSLFVRALSIYRKFYDENHIYIADEYNSIGLVYSNLNQQDSAIYYLDKALIIFQEIYGEIHSKIATVYNNLAIAYWKKGRNDVAINALEKALFIFTKILPANHPQILEINNSVRFAHGQYGLELCEKKRFWEGVQQFHFALYYSNLMQDTAAIILYHNEIGVTFKDLMQCDSALIYLNNGILLIEYHYLKLNETIKYLSNKEKENPDFINKINQQKHIYKRLRFHKAGCLHRLDRKEEAAALFAILKQEAILNKDQNLLEEIKQEGY